MTKQIFSVYDSAAGAFLDPFVAPTIEFAIRDFRRICNTEGNSISNFPADYTLFHIATFHIDTGQVVPLKAHANLGVAITFIQNTEENDA